MVSIKDVDFPDSCFDCHLRFNGFCIPDKRHRYVGQGEEVSKTSRKEWCPLSQESDTVKVESIGIYDQEEIYDNCTVQIWSNSATGEVSVGWWRNE